MIKLINQNQNYVNLFFLRFQSYLIGVTEFAVVAGSDNGADEIMATDAKLPIEFIVVIDVDREAERMSPFRRQIFTISCAALDRRVVHLDKNKVNTMSQSNLAA